MKLFLITLTLICVSVLYSYGQTGRNVTGTVLDTTRATIPGATITLTSEIKSDSTTFASDNNGHFVAPNIKGDNITLAVSFIGYRGIRKHFVLKADGQAASVGAIILKTESDVLGTVTVKGVVPIKFSEDTTKYNVGAYKVRDNAPIEDVIKKLPGVDVDINGNITTQGKQITKVRINGKDFMGGDVLSITKNLPADVAEEIQVIDDYGDQANLTGIKTGEPDKILNITIRKDKNYGYSLQGTVGDGEDALPAASGPDQNRYLGTITNFTFNGDQQTAVLGSINNTNVNTFSFGNTSNGGGGGGGGGFGRGGGGRGNASRALANSGTLITAANGTTEAHSIGVNFRDQWGKNLAVYGSYSFADNTVNTITQNNQQNLSAANPSINNQNSNETDRNTNHRFTWNMEYTPDTSNFLKVVPSFSYAGVNTNDVESVSLSQLGAITSAYNSTNYSTSTAPTFGLTALYNHKFRRRHNFSALITLGSTTSNSYQNPIYDYTVGAPTAPPDQMITTYSRTNSVGATLSYIEPLGHVTFLELNYAFNFASTDNDKDAVTSPFTPPLAYFSTDSALSNKYNYTFMTNKIGLNFRVVHPKYNYVLGLGVQPAELNGTSPMTGAETHVSTFDVVPTAKFVYNFSKSHSFNFNYNASSTSPTFTQLQPVTDISNALYPVQGNPDLKPEFTNNISVRYNSFDFNTGNVLFTNLMYTQISNYITTNTVTYAPVYAKNPAFQNTILTQYLNVPGRGYSDLTAGAVYTKPWEERKFSLSLTGQLAYTNTINYLTSVSNADSLALKNVAKNFQITPGIKFRVDIPDHIDAQLWTTYAINNTNNTVSDSLTNGTENVRTWNIYLNGKQYFGDWTFSYDYEKAIYYGYASNLKVTNPNILNLYVERRFLKNHAATFRISAFDLFNQNTGFTDTVTPSSITESHVNRLSRYFLGTFTLRLQKFAGKAPDSDPTMRNFRHGGHNGGGGGGSFGGGID